MDIPRSVEMWEEDVEYLSYETAEPEKSPLFFERRVYQGSSGKVYPFPVTERFEGGPSIKSYNAVFLENEYLKVMVLPELGGRIHRAFDKTNNYDFIYYNHVIKPALVGLIGPWISGGIEFNWPQHHRPTSFLPVDYTMKENRDGSKTVWVGESDRMYGTKGMAGITLYPGKAYIEIRGQLYNETEVPQSFLWWANPAVPVNDHTVSVFPPDVNAVMDHGKRAVSTFPIATGEYYKYDYSSGIDISRYKNIKVPTSYMAHHSEYDFFGNYDEQLETGVLHVADHHLSPGKKQWTWGCSDFGLAWDRNLTDTDGPYIELMAGVYTDNQPDFTWLKPHEEKTFTQYFFPYKGVGHAKNATKEAVINYSFQEETIEVILYVTSEQTDAMLSVMYQDDELFTAQISLTPASSETIGVPNPERYSDDLLFLLKDSTGHTLVQVASVKRNLHPVPNPEEPLLPPERLQSIEELWLAGMHLEQYHHASFCAEDYYSEGLRRDPTDIRLNNSYGLLCYRKGLFEESVSHFQRAISKQTWRNPNPYYGECYYNLGLAQLMLGDDEAAYDAFFKAVWSSETQSSAWYQLACIHAKKKRYNQAVAFARKAVIRNWHNMKARTVLAAAYRHVSIDNTELLTESLEIDPLDRGSVYEQELRNDSPGFVKMFKDHEQSYLLLSLDYAKMGFFEDAVMILKLCPKKTPLIHYYTAYMYVSMND